MSAANELDNTTREIPYLQANMYYINILMTPFLMTLRRFPKIFQKLSEGQTNVSEHFRIFSKITEDFRGRSDDVSIIQQYINTVQKISCVAIASLIFLQCTCENTLFSQNNTLFLHVEICLRAKAHLVFHWWLYHKCEVLQTWEILECNCFIVCYRYPY